MNQPWIVLILILIFFSFSFSFFFLICSEFCHTLKWNVLEFTCLNGILFSYLDPQTKSNILVIFPVFLIPLHSNKEKPSLGVSLMAQLVKNLPAMWETWVWSLGWEDPLEKGKATTTVFWPGEFRGLYSLLGRKESDTTEQLSLFYHSGVILPFS